MSESNSQEKIQSFIDYWSKTEAAERANYQLFLSQLCEILDVPKPEGTKADDRENEYVFERSVAFQNPDGTSTTKFIDLYKRDSFVLEAKQGSERDAEKGRRGDAEKKKLKKGTAVRGTGGWDVAMQKAKGQAEQYARNLPSYETLPPFLVVVDVGYSFELYSDFSRSGKTYLPFPDARNHRISIKDLTKEEVRERLQKVWTNPFELDPSRRSARITRDVAKKLADLAKSLEEAGYEAERVAAFLMRSIFTMFAEDVRLLPKHGFTKILEEIKERDVKIFPAMIGSLWADMNEGRFSQFLMQKLLRFNGGLFESCEALPINKSQLDLLIEASKADWRDVEPAIFGTLLERALDPIERHKLGAHYTPRAYVERLVMPTIIEPLRDDWEAVKTAVITLHNEGNDKEALKEVRAFLTQLCKIKVLDPACGSGNFLYVTMEHTKRLEGEVRDVIAGLSGSEQEALEYVGLTVDPHQFLGIEVNPRATAIADLVLWIGYLQWHFRTRGDVLPAEPVLHNYQNIEHRDAVLAYDSVEPLLDEAGEPVTRWDGRTKKIHPVTNEEVPDETARVQVLKYNNPRPADWQEADYIVGNPPFIGTWRMRQELGDGYAEAIRKVYKDVPDSADFVMYWWEKAATLLREGKIKRFGFITTNSLRQTFNRRVIEFHLSNSPIKKTKNTEQTIVGAGLVPARNQESNSTSNETKNQNLISKQIETKNQNLISKQRAGTSPAPTIEIKPKPLSLIFAIPDHPWVDTEDAAAVRISMTVAEASEHEGKLFKVVKETTNEEDEVDVVLSESKGKIFADLTTGANVAGIKTLKANEKLTSVGVMLAGAGFIVSQNDANKLGLRRIAGLEKHIRPYLNGRDLTTTPRKVMVIDLFGLTEKQVRDDFPETYQWVYERVKPERDHNNRASRKNNWWIFGEPIKTFRPAFVGLSRYIATPETSKHRFFVLLNESILPDKSIVFITLEDAFYFGVLSSQIHVTWALATGGILGPTPRYNKTRCFDTFPFPETDEERRGRIRELGEALDAHRKRQQSLHTKLTITDMYNVLAKLRSGESLTDKERVTHEQGLVSVLKQIHDDLDKEVSAAYGWAADLSDEEILQNLVALNATRAAEERRGVIRWLRPDYQRPTAAPTQTAFDNMEVVEVAETKQTKQPFPKTLSEQARAVRTMLQSQTSAVTSEELARLFTRARVERVEELLQTLVELGQAREVEKGKYST